MMKEKKKNEVEVNIKRVPVGHHVFVLTGLSILLRQCLATLILLFST